MHCLLHLLFSGNGSMNLSISFKGKKNHFFLSIFDAHISMYLQSLDIIAQLVITEVIYSM
jgi:hypothetical protein